MRLTTRGAVGSSNLSRLTPWTCLQGTLFLWLPSKLTSVTVTLISQWAKALLPRLSLVVCYTLNLSFVSLTPTSRNILYTECTYVRVYPCFETWNQGSSGQQQLVPGLPPEYVFKAPFFSFSCCFFYLKPFLCFTVFSFNKRILIIMWTQVVRSFLHEIKNPHTTSGPKADPLWAQTPSTPSGNNLTFPTHTHTHTHTHTDVLATEEKLSNLF